MDTHEPSSDGTFHVQFVAIGDSDFGWVGLGYLSTALKAIPGVSVGASYFSQAGMDEGCEAVVACRPDLVGLPVLQANLRPVREFVRRTRPRLPEAHFTLGNREVTAQPELMLDWCDGVDSVVFGEAELTLAEIVRRLIAHEAFDECAGAHFRVGSRVIRNPGRPLERDLERLGNPDRDVLPTENSFLLPNEAQRVFPVLSARGCTAFCTFCEVGRVKPGEMRVRSMDHVLDEVATLMRERDATYILFSDDSFEDGHPVAGQRFRDLCRGIRHRQLDFRFFLMCKASAVDTDAIAIFQELKDAGLDQLFIGFEAGNDADLKLYGKSSRTRDNVRALEILEDLDITVNPGFIMFNPYSTFARLRENIEFLLRFGFLCSTDIVSSRLFLFSGVPLTRKVFRDGLVQPGVDFPVAEAHGYRFADPRIGEAWEAVRGIGVPAAMDSMLGTESLTRWLTDPNSAYRDDPIVGAFRTIFDDFRLAANRQIAELLTEILARAEAGEVGMDRALQTERDALRAELDRSWQVVNKAGLLIRSLLAAQGRLPIGNHAFAVPGQRRLFGTANTTAPVAMEAATATPSRRKNGRVGSAGEA